MRRFATAPPPGLSPRIAALVRRADGAAADARADVAAAVGDSASRAAAPPPPAAAARAALVARNSAALAELRDMLGGAGSAAADGGAARRRADGDSAAGGDDDALLRDVRGITTRARRGDQAGALATDAAMVMMRHDLGVGRDGAARLAPSRPASEAAAALRERRDAAWQNILARGTDAAGVGWLLRGFFQDHARQMDGDELAELEALLRCSSDALASYVGRQAAPPAHLAALPAYRLLCQYHRFWSGAGHEPGGEYV